MVYGIDRGNRGIVNPYRIRSWLFIPAVKENFFDKIMDLDGENKPDVIVFDLEDSVHVDYKEGAREILRSRLYEDVVYRKEFFRKYVGTIRANSYDTEWFKEDLKLIDMIKPDFFALSKVESADQIRFVRHNSSASQLFVPIETIRGFRNRERIMREMQPHDVFVVGYEDLSAELMIERPELDSVNPLTKIILRSIVSARKNNIIMIDAVSRKYGTPENIKSLEEECRYTAEKLGLSSKVAIHPSQVPVINSVFDKDPLIERAKEILGKFEELEDGSFVITNEKKEMMDTPSYRMYSKILDLWNRK